MIFLPHHSLKILLLLIACFVVSKVSFSQFDKEILRVENTIESGDLWDAENHLNQLLKGKNNNDLNSYHALKLLTKIYLTQQDFNQYKKTTDKLVPLAHHLGPIYLSEAYAHQAYYWHFLMWGDSAVHYSNKSFDLLKNHRGDFKKIDPAFVFEIYAITYLYRKDKLKISAYDGLGLLDYQRKQFFYFDSCLIIQQKFPFKFSSDKAAFYRAYGNRLLDLVSSYRACTKEETKKFTKKQWYGFFRANELYDEGLKAIKPCHKNEFINLKSLKAMNYTLVGEWRRAESIFNSVYQYISTKEFMNRKLVAYFPMKVFLSLKIRNSILLPYIRQNIDRDIGLLEELKKEFWGVFLSDCDLPYDPYRLSPYVDLFNLYYFKSRNETNSSEFLYQAVSNLLTMKSYFHYLQNGIDKTLKKIPYFTVRTIQEHLKDDEAYLLFQNDEGYLWDKKILITRNTIEFVKVKNNSLLNQEDLGSIPFNKFKYISHLDYKDNFSDIVLKFPALKKLYICYDDQNPYEVFINNQKGDDFSQLNYLGKDISVVRVYNPASYFSTPIEYNYSQTDVRFLQQQGASQLLFTNDYFTNARHFSNFSFQKYSGEFAELLQKNGILHLFGHGELSIDKPSNVNNFQWSYLQNDKLFTIKRLSGEFSVNRDLVVLNQCYSGYANFNTNEFNKTIPLRIMSNGAKAVISSPNLVDDYYSAEFFKLFYDGVLNNELFEDAFFKARKTFFEAHPELSNPRNWSSLQFMVSNKIKYTNVLFNRSLFLILLICMVDLFLTFSSVHVQKRQ